MDDIMDVDGPDMPARTGNETDARVEAALNLLAGGDHHIDCPRSHARMVLHELAVGKVPENRWLGRPVKFAFRERKALECLLYVLKSLGQSEPVPDRLVLRILYDAERTHLRTYGRPILCDTYVASPLGPTGTMVASMLRGELRGFAAPGLIAESLLFDPSATWGCPLPRRKPDLDLVSRSDTEALDASVERCRSRALRSSELTQAERAWNEAPAGAVMDWADILDPGEDGYDGALEHLRMTAAYAMI